MSDARMIEWNPSDEPLLTATDAMHEEAVEHLIIRDVTGTYADIKAVCCRRCGYTQEYADVLGTHRCMSPERQDRLVTQGMEAFRRVASRLKQQKDVVSWERLGERLAWHLSDALAVLKANRIKIVPTYGDDGTKALADFRSMIPADRMIPRDYQ